MTRQYGKTPCAIANSLVIVTKDEDFQSIATRHSSPRPQVVWVRIGNCRKVALLAAFASVLPAMRDLLAAGEAVIEIRQFACGGIGKTVVGSDMDIIPAMLKTAEANVWELRK